MDNIIYNTMSISTVYLLFSFRDQPPEPMKKTEPEKKTDETAFDIRTDLIQATDILVQSIT
jgi:hypothetical protein